MIDVYEKGYGVFFPDTNIVSEVFNLLSSNSSNQIAGDNTIKVLDVGCGIGANMKFLEYFPNMTYVGVDVSPVATRLLGEQIILKGFEKRAKIFNGSIEDFLATSSDRFDLILDRASLQHLKVMIQKKDGAAFLEDLVSRLSINGSLISLWASELNSGARIRFPVFTGFENYSSHIQEIATVLKLARISKSIIRNKNEEMMTTEYLILLQAR